MACPLPDINAALFPVVSCCRRPAAAVWRRIPGTHVVSPASQKDDQAI